MRIMAASGEPMDTILAPPRELLKYRNGLLTA